MEILEYGQLLRPKEIRHLIRSIGRIPAERNTTYKKIKEFEVEPTGSEGLDGVDDAKKFGSYFELINIHTLIYTYIGQIIIIILFSYIKALNQPVSDFKKLVYYCVSILICVGPILIFLSSFLILKILKKINYF